MEMDKCAKKDCVDFDVPIEDVEFGLDSCKDCYYNRQNPNWLSSLDNFVKVDKIVNPTVDVPPVQDQGGAIDTTAFMIPVDDLSPRSTAIPTMKDRRDAAGIFIEAYEYGPTSEEDCVLPDSYSHIPLSAVELQMDANKMTTFADVLDDPKPETFDRCNTGLDQKKDNFDAFSKLIANQFMHGGQKYALKGDKEFTDAICEAFPGASGVDWVLGTCMKYLGRYKNFGREKDLLKVATYMYLLWLKGGFHKQEDHDEDTKRGE